MRLSCYDLILRTAALIPMSRSSLTVLSDLLEHMIPPLSLLFGIFLSRAEIDGKMVTPPRAAITTFRAHRLINASGCHMYILFSMSRGLLQYWSDGQRSRLTFAAANR